MWDLLGPGLEPVSPALAGRFFTIAPPGKSAYAILMVPARTVIRFLSRLMFEAPEGQDDGLKLRPFPSTPKTVATC